MKTKALSACSSSLGHSLISQRLSENRSIYYSPSRHLPARTCMSQRGGPAYTFPAPHRPGRHRVWSPGQGQWESWAQSGECFWGHSRKTKSPRTRSEFLSFPGSTFCLFLQARGDWWGRVGRSLTTFPKRKDPFLFSHQSIPAVTATTVRGRVSEMWNP